MMAASGGTQKTVLSLALILAVGFIAYSNTFQVPFQLDEDFYLRENPFIVDYHYPIESLKPEREPAQPLKQRITGQELYSTLKMRYIGYLTFAVNHRVHGFAVEGYHLVNLIIHLLNAVLVYILVVTVFRTPVLAQSFLKDRATSLALFSALLFVSHPLQTEAVTYIMQRIASLTALFYLFSVVSYVRARCTVSLSRRYALYAGSLISAVLAMKTKENAFTLPLVIGVFELVLFPGNVKQRLTFLAPLFATMLIIPLSLIMMGGDEIGAILRESRTTQPSSYFFTQLRVIVTYIGMLLVPLNQSIFHDIRISTSFLEPAVISSFLLIVSILGYGWYLLFRSGSSDQGLRLVVIGIAWFFLSLSVESSILPLPIIMCEYRVYLPSVGFFIALLSGLYAVTTNIQSKRMAAFVPVLLVAAVMALSSMTYARNMKWGDTVGLWEDALSRSPLSPAVHWKLGAFYLKQGRVDEAIRRFTTAMSMGMDHPRIHYDLGTAYHQRGRYDEAIREYRTALSLYPGSVETHYSLAGLFLQLGRYGEAVTEYQDAVRLKPDFVEAHNNLAGVYVHLGRYAEAKRELESVLKINPGLEDARFNLRMVEELLGNQGAGRGP